MKLAAILSYCLLTRTFDTATVRRQPTSSIRGALVRQISPTGITFRNASLGNLITWAYGFEHFRVVGPAWLNRPTDVVFDVAAKNAAAASEDELKAMLQALLKERLGLTVHREQRELPVYGLVLAHGPSKLRRSESAGDPSMEPVEPLKQRYRRFTMAILAETLDPPFTSRHTIDETGLTGAFDFMIDLTDAQADPAGRLDMESAYLHALPAQLGLRLEKKIALTEMLIVDRAEKEPSAN